MNHQIKIARAFRTANVFQGQRTAAHILNAIPEPIVAALSSAQLALMLEAMDAHWHSARNFETQAVLAEGAVWDSRKQKLREISA